MKRLAAVAALFPVLALAALPGFAATCPFNVPVVSLPGGPHPSGFNWSAPPIVPMNDPCLQGIVVDPTDDKVWYVTGGKGLYVTHNGGAAWMHPLAGAATGQTVALAPANPAVVFAGHGTVLSRSTNKGVTWTTLHTFPMPISSVLASPGGKLWVGLSWGASPMPNGVFFSPDNGLNWQAQPFGGGAHGLICWDIERDPLDGTLYVATEIFNHPQPYHPPLFRSSNGGQTWTNVAGTLPWHVIALAVRPADHYVYALTEGPGLYGSSNHGATWIPPLIKTGPSVSLLMNPKSPLKLYGGRQKVGLVTGGAFVSVNAGKVFHPIGLDGVTVGGLSLNGARTKLFATAYASGIYISPVPASLQP